MEYRSSVEHLLRQAREHPDLPAYHCKEGGTWRPTPWKKYAEEVREAARALMALGLEPGDTICLLGFNRPEWTTLDLAAMMVGGIPAGIYVTSSAEEIRYIVDHAESRWLLVETVEHWQKVRGQRHRLPRLERVIFMEGAAVPEDPLALSWQSFRTRAQEVPEELLDGRIGSLEADQVATLIYTSGTTGPPKGVMLSHDNLLWTARTALAEMFAIGPADCALSYLPLSHIAERIFSVHGSVLAGYSVYFAQSPEKVPEDLRDVQPTLIFGVPRVWEKLAGAVQEKLREASPGKQRLVRWACGVGGRITALLCRGEKARGTLALTYRLARLLVLDRIKPLLGLGRARLCVSGAAPISRDVLDFFAGLGILIYEVYGQSEGSGPTTLNRPGQTRLGTVGLPLPNVEVRIAEDSEILVRGRNVFLGYFKDPASTAESLEDGWLASGDLGRLDEEGFLTIIGRKKDILITSGGKNIAPGNLEIALRELDLIQDAVVFGDGRRFLVALLTLDPETAEALAPDGTGPSSLSRHPAVLAAVEDGVGRVNQRFSRVQHIRRYRVLEQTFSVESGELTPTLKLKRKVIGERYAAEVDALYED